MDEVEISLKFVSVLQTVQGDEGQGVFRAVEVHLFERPLKHWKEVFLQVLVVRFFDLRMLLLLELFLLLVAILYPLDLGRPVILQ